MYVQRSSEARRCNYFWSRKTINSTYSERVFVALGIQHSMHVSGSKIFLSVISWTAQFSKISYWIYNMCFWFSLQILSEIFLILRRIERDVIKICFGLHVKCPLFWSDFAEIWVFTTDFRKIHKYEISWKSVEWGLLSSHSVGGRPVHRTATYRVWWYLILYNTIWPPDDEHNSARNT